MLFVLYLKSVKSEIVAHPVCLSLISLKRGTRALFFLGAGFHNNKIILLYHNRDVFTAAFKYVKRSFRFFIVLVCKISHPLSAVGRFGLVIKYRHIFATVIQLNHFGHNEISNKPRSKHRAITVKSRQIQCKHSYSLCCKAITAYHVQVLGFSENIM